MYKKDLEKDVMSDTSGHFKRLLVSQLAASREEPTSVDNAKADQDADDFFKVSVKPKTTYSRPCLKRPLKNRQNKGLKDRW